MQSISIEQRLDLLDARLNSVVRLLEQQQASSSREWLPTGAMARQLGVTDRALRNWAGAGRLPSDCFRIVQRGDREERLFHASRTAAAADKLSLYGRA